MFLSEKTPAIMLDISKGNTCCKQWSTAIIMWYLVPFASHESAVDRMTSVEINCLIEDSRF